MSRDPQISALVVSHRSEATLGACLASLVEESRRISLEIVVVDNASPDRSLDIARATLGPEQVIAAPDNRGFAWAVNRAAERARGSYLFLLNPDATLRPGALVELRRCLDADAGAAIAGPRIVGSDGRAELSDGPVPGFLGEAWQRLRAHLPGREWRSHRPRRVDWVSGAALLVRSDDFRAVGGMDEAFFLYFEDADLCARIRARGRDVLFWPKAVVEHRRGHSARQAPAATAAAYRRSQLHFYRKHLGAEAETLLGIYLAMAGKLPSTRGATGEGGAPRRR